MLPPTNQPDEWYGRLYLFQKTKLVPVKDITETIEKKKQNKFGDADKKKWIEWADQAQFLIDDFDKAELITHFFLSRHDKMTDEQLSLFDPMPPALKAQLNEPSSELRRKATVSASQIGKSVLPRVRAKLAFLEVAAIFTLDESLLFRLLEVTPRYLSCPYIQSQISNASYKSRFAEGRDRKGGEAFLKKLHMTLQGDRRKKSRLYPYWSLDYYYQEVFACIKNYAAMPKDSEREDYLDCVCAYWGISETYKRKIIEKPSKASDLTLSIMVERNMIPDTPTFRNVIQKEVKKLKTKYPYLRGCDPVVERLLDYPSTHPNIFAKYDVWGDVENLKLSSL